MNPSKVVEAPPYGGRLDALAWVVRQGGFGLLERVAAALFSGRIDKQTDGHDHQQGHDTFRFFQIPRRGQALRGLEEANPTWCPGLAFGAVEHRLGGSLRLVPCVRREDTPPRLVDAGPMGREL
jgi:hypothetical protein